MSPPDRGHLETPQAGGCGRAVGRLGPSHLARGLHILNLGWARDNGWVDIGANTCRLPANVANNPVSVASHNVSWDVSGEIRGWQENVGCVCVCVCVCCVLGFVEMPVHMCIESSGCYCVCVCVCVLEFVDMNLFIRTRFKPLPAAIDFILFWTELSIN